MSNTIYLYLKTHNKTGLKYLGKTIQDPLKYRGSGKRWNNHIKKHGYDVTTEILFESSDAEKIKEKGLYFSEVWNIVESQEFANLKIEEGDGGFSHVHSNNETNLYRLNQLQKAIKEGRVGGRTTGSFQKGDPKVLELSKKANNAKRKKIQQNPNVYKESYKKISESMSGEGNSQFGKVWCIEKTADDYSKRKSFHPNKIPSGWISIKEHRETRKNKKNSAYGKKWYNDGHKSYLLKEDDQRIVDFSLTKGRIL